MFDDLENELKRIDRANTSVPPGLVWYFVLSGFELEKAEQVHHMYPQAVAAPLKDETTNYMQQGGAGNWTKTHSERHRYFLLEAACRSPLNINDDILAFIAKSYPTAASRCFKGRQLPYSLRIFKSTRNLASLELIKAIVPQMELSLSLLRRLFTSGYSADILHYVVDNIVPRPQGVSKRFGGDTCLKLSPWSTSSDMGGLLDLSRAKVLEHLLLYSNSAPTIQALHARPKQWTQEGLCHTLRSLKESQSVQRLNLEIRLQEFLYEQSSAASVLALLEDLFATNTSIETLCLTVPDTYLEAIVRGLARARNTGLQKLTLHEMFVSDISVLEPFLVGVTSELELVLCNTEAEGWWRLAEEELDRVFFELKSCKMTPGLMVQTLHLMPLAARPRSLELEPFPQNETVDITGCLHTVFDQCYLDKLLVKGPPSN